AVASEYVAQAAPDGYTLLLSTASTHAVLPAYRHDLTYDTIKSFAPATLVATFPNMLVVNPRKVPVHTVAARALHGRRPSVKPSPSRNRRSHVRQHGDPVAAGSAGPSARPPRRQPQAHTARAGRPGHCRDRAWLRGADLGGRRGAGPHSGRDREQDIRSLRGGGKPARRAQAARKPRRYARRRQTCR